MHAVALKLPEFWQEHAAVWFAQAEAQFALRGITQEDTKYFYVVAALNSSTASRVLSLLQDPPEADKYLALKQLLLETFELNRRLVNAETFATLPGSPSSTGTSKLSSALSSADMFQRLLMDFPDLTTPTFSSAAVKHGVDHFIATTGPPVHARARRLDPQKLAVAKAEFDSMERLGIVHDILVASVTSDEHQAHLRALFARLSEHGLIINLAKCQFGVPVVDFLGHRVTREAVRHFRFLLEGRTFTAFVDHKPLALAMAMVKEPWSARQQRQLAFVSEFTTDIQHVAGKDNVVADCLSRSIVDAVNLGVDYGQMAADQASDPGRAGVTRSDYRSRNPAPDLNPDPGDSPKTDSGMGPDPSGAAGKKLGRFGRVIQTPRRFCCHSKFWGGLCSEHWGERGRIPCGNTPTFSDSPDR
ncbi:hypothetical protein AAFF_G00228010 [Aldrovandia affinis]|uniref:ribonuclease H n=1 Tax=Aldrovandia affinis TaxID=143900 RepID=A0AAD7SVE6_9TELE|nr:hypothetical protein AAFF_G00228010 [Aldrovandia affinis]